MCGCVRVCCYKHALTHARSMLSFCLVCRAQCARLLGASRICAGPAELPGCTFPCGKAFLPLWCRRQAGPNLSSGACCCAHSARGPKHGLVIYARRKRTKTAQAYGHYNGTGVIQRAHVQKRTEHVHSPFFRNGAGGACVQNCGR